MNQTIKDQWVTRLTDPNLFSATRFLHLPGGAFDCLGVLCDIYLQAVYLLNSGQGQVGADLLLSIQTTRQTIVDKIRNAGGIDFEQNLTLNGGVSDLYKSDTILPRDKKEIQRVWGAVVSEQVTIDAISASFNDSQFNAVVGLYDTAIEVYRQWLAGLSNPGGWDNLTKSWRLDYTSIDTSDRWVLSSDGTYYIVDDYFDKLPESVQNWAELYTQDPVVLVSDAYGFHGIEMGVFLNKLHDGTILKNDAGVARAYTLLEMADLVNFQL
jgi:hypothetical protein